MRLLKYIESDQSPGAYSFSLTKCDPRKPPPYAILSHRWGADNDEVTFRDFEQGTAQTRVGGYRKLTFCARQATCDKLDYFWVDTCCIDKDSSAELQEAINSMYNWYSHADKCYVYLPDVPTKQGQEWEAAFQKSEWFERGWTLQELIAPRIVKFFSIDGQILGDKQSLQQQIHQITGVSIEVLQGKSLTEVSEQERFSWTTGRQTKVEEDAVYCLLGIFGVHMPLIYSEGYSKARARLRREIQIQTRPELHTVVVAPPDRQLHVPVSTLALPQAPLRDCYNGIRRLKVIKFKPQILIALYPHGRRARFVLARWSRIRGTVSEVRAVEMESSEDATPDSYKPPLSLAIRQIIEGFVLRQNWLDVPEVQ